MKKQIQEILKNHHTLSIILPKQQVQLKGGDGSIQQYHFIEDSVAY